MYQHVGSWSWFLGRKVHLSATAAPTRMNIALPPDILDTGTSTDMVVREGSNVSFQCAASGSPPPSITWRRESGEPITLPTGVEDRCFIEYRTLIIRTPGAAFQLGCVQKPNRSHPRSLSSKIKSRFRMDKREGQKAEPLFRVTRSPRTAGQFSGDVFELHQVTLHCKYLLAVEGDAAGVCSKSISRVTLRLKV
ncbi:unnamed protein product, partial [Nesidiocoris tenuis]